jgi:hypothetical protein
VCTILHDSSCDFSPVFSFYFSQWMLFFSNFFSFPTSSFAQVKLADCGCLIFLKSPLSRIHACIQTHLRMHFFSFACLRYTFGGVKPPFVAGLMGTIILSFGGGSSVSILTGTKLSYFSGGNEDFLKADFHIRFTILMWYVVSNKEEEKEDMKE